jgi:LPXTG-motif cell wall-anchored protein
MNINYSLVGLVALAGIILLIFLIRRNQKDKKDFEKDITKSEIEPEQHKDAGENKLL